jgi:uncharacterized cofD-like protein
LSGSGRLRPDGPRVVAIGGGHGLARTLLAVREYAGEITAVVSVADDGGSSGRLRDELGIPAPGDVRRCLGALLPEQSPLAEALEYRYEDGALDGHAFGNLLITALARALGDFTMGIAEAGRLLGAVGAVLPATSGPVVLKAVGVDGVVEGQVRVMATRGVSEVSLVPPDAQPPPLAVERLLEADQIVIGPGSLYTSLLAACAVPALREAVSVSDAQRVYVANLREQRPETEGYDVAAHVTALRRHGISPDVVLADSDALPIGRLGTGTRLVQVRLAASGAGGHDVGGLAAGLAGVLDHR